ncbi:hypothetical protein X975_21139, partial [Stegodyphus mimosarum]
MAERKLPWRRSRNFDDDAESRPSQVFHRQRLLLEKMDNDQSLKGKWVLSCTYEDRDENGLSELDRAWAAGKELYKEGITEKVSCFSAKLPKKPYDEYKTRNVECFVRNYNNISEIKRIADAFRRKFHYPCLMYYRVYEDKLMTKYIHTAEGELYKVTDNGDRELVSE